MRTASASIGLLLALAAPGLAAEPAVELLSGPYVIAPEKTGATVCWQTGKQAPGRVRYRLEGAKQWREAAGELARFQAVKLSGLEPGARYELKVLSGAKELGELTFGTAPEKLDRFSFFVYGDTRSNPEGHAEIAAAVAAEAGRLKQFTFWLTTGDLAINGSDEFETAEQFFRPAEPVLRLMPLLPLRGNHECGTDLYRRYFPAPPRSPAGGGADDYFVDYGPVRVIVLDQYEAARGGGPRMKWLAARLAEAGDKWRFAAFHEPIYSSGSHGSNTGWRSMVEPVLREGRVHAVFCGHDHNYERTRSIGGITYFTSGGGGAPLRSGWGNPRDFSAKFEAVYHFLTVAVSPQKLMVRAHRASEKGHGGFEVFDSVEIPRECGWPKAKQAGGREAPQPAEVFYGCKPNPWKRPLLYGAIALFCLAVAARVIAVLRRNRKGAGGAT